MAPGTLEDVDVEHPTPGTAIAVFSGEHDLATKDEVQGLLSSLVDANEHVVADFSTARFVDSSILSVVQRVDASAEGHGCTFRLQLATTDIVRRAFEVTGLLEVIDVATTRGAALKRAV